MAAHLEVRAKDVAAARKVFGRGIGVAPKEKLFKGYIELELQLGVCLRVLVVARELATTQPSSEQRVSGKSLRTSVDNAPPAHARQVTSTEYAPSMRSSSSPSRPTVARGHPSRSWSSLSASWTALAPSLSWELRNRCSVRV